jgi:hypothetical protein
MTLSPCPRPFLLIVLPLYVAGLQVSQLPTYFTFLNSLRTLDLDSSAIR